MKKAIYKITNKINGHIYIGFSNDPQRRWQEHKKSTQYISLIHRAIKKYGEENFTFEILEWTENYKEREKYWIKHYRCLAPYGYNINEGGGDPPHYNGEENPASKLTQQQADAIIDDFLDWKIPRKQIVKKHQITENIARHIIAGDCWKRKGITYPLRPTEKELNEQRADKVIELLQNTKLTQKEIGKQVGWNRSAVTMINIGKNHHRDNLDYPIRK